MTLNEKRDSKDFVHELMNCDYDNSLELKRLFVHDHNLIKSWKNGSFRKVLLYRDVREAINQVFNELRGYKDLTSEKVLKKFKKVFGEELTK